VLFTNWLNTAVRAVFKMTEDRPKIEWGMLLNRDITITIGPIPSEMDPAKLTKLLLLKNYKEAWMETDRGLVLKISERAGPADLEHGRAPQMPQSRSVNYSIEALFKCGIPTGQPPVEILRALRGFNKGNTAFLSTASRDGSSLPFAAFQRINCLACSETEILAGELKKAVLTALGDTGDAPRFRWEMDITTKTVTVHVDNIPSDRKLEDIITILLGQGNKGAWSTGKDGLVLLISARRRPTFKPIAHPMARMPTGFSSYSMLLQYVCCEETWEARALTLKGLTYYKKAQAGVPRKAAKRHAAPVLRNGSAAFPSARTTPARVSRTDVVGLGSAGEAVAKSSIGPRKFGKST